MRFRDFQNLAVELASALLATPDRKGNVGRHLRFDVRFPFYDDHLGDPRVASFVVYAPSNYVQVAIGDSTIKFRNPEWMAQRSLDDGWYEICCHDSCWRDQWDYNLLNINSSVEVEVLRVRLWDTGMTKDQVPPFSAYHALWKNAQKDTAPVLDTQSLLASPTGDSKVAFIAEVLTFIATDHFQRHPQDGSTLAFDFTAWSRSASRQLHRVLRWRLAQGPEGKVIPTLASISTDPRKPPKTAKGTGSFAGDIEKHVVKVWAKNPDFGACAYFRLFE